MAIKSTAKIKKQNTSYVHVKRKHDSGLLSWQKILIRYLTKKKKKKELYETNSLSNSSFLLLYFRKTVSLV